MSPNLSRLLYTRYPDFFGQRSMPPTQSLMCFGIETGDGWVDLLDAVCAVVSEHALETGHPVIQASQIKEKYGSLRIYASTYDDFEDGVIDFAEALSERICEVAGTPGQPCKRGGWHRTLSPTEAAREGYTALEPVPAADEEHAAALAQRHAAIIAGPVAVPAGWTHVADAYLGFLGRGDGLIDVSDIGEDGKVPAPKPPTVRVRLLVPEGGRLLAVIQDADDWACGVTALLAALSARLDQETGAPVRLKAP